MAKKESPKLTLAKMTYEHLQKVNSSLYIVDYWTTEERIINIHTGLVVQKLRENLSVPDRVIRCKGGLALVTCREEGVTRIYSDEGNCIYVIKGILTYIQKDELLSDEQSILVFKDRVIICDRGKQQVIEDYNGILNIYYEDYIILVRSMDINKNVKIHKYIKEFYS